MAAGFTVRRRRQLPLLAVIGALLLFADYTITASLSAVDAFHYFGLGEHSALVSPGHDAGSEILLHTQEQSAARELPLWDYHGPGLWAIVAIGVIGVFNLMGPKHTAGFAVAAAAGMVVITLLIAVCAIPQIHLSKVNFGNLHQPPLDIWQGFVAIVLALSGCEAIANLTGVMDKPVYRTASKAIWVVALEVAIFNLILGLAMIAIYPLSRQGHKEDMLAYMAHSYVGAWGEWPVRVIGGLLLLSATNTAVNGLMSITYVMSRDNELPRMFQKLNSFGAPWVGAVVAAAIPALVLLFFHDLETLAHLYAIGIVGAVAINCTLCAFHPRLRKFRRKLPMLLLGVVLIAIWVTLAITKIHALIFVTIVLIVGLTMRQITRAQLKRRPKPSLLRQAIMEQLPADAMLRPKVLLATAGTDQLAETALEIARQLHAALVVCFVRDVALSYKVEAEARFTLDTDPARQAAFAHFLYGHAHRSSVPDHSDMAFQSDSDPAELIAEHAAMNGVEKVLIGSSRRGSLHRLVKGSFEQNLESLLPPEVPIQVISTN